MISADIDANPNCSSHLWRRSGQRAGLSGETMPRWYTPSHAFVPATTMTAPMNIAITGKRGRSNRHETGRNGCTGTGFIRIRKQSLTNETATMNAAKPQVETIKVHRMRPEPSNAPVGSLNCPEENAIRTESFSQKPSHRKRPMKVSK